MPIAVTYVKYINANSILQPYVIASATKQSLLLGGDDVVGSRRS
jgi:hypothetical protein